MKSKFEPMMQVILISGKDNEVKELPEFAIYPEYITYNGRLFELQLANKYLEINSVWNLKD